LKQQKLNFGQQQKLEERKAKKKFEIQMIE